MKTMTCKQLGGACDNEFHVNTFDEMAELSRKHGQEMGEAGDKAHLGAMNNMKALMNDPAGMKKWMDDREDEFEALPDNKQKGPCN